MVGWSPAATVAVVLGRLDAQFVAVLGQMAFQVATCPLDAFFGTAKLLAETGMSPEKLVQMVSSPKGTTVAGREVLEGSNYAKVIGKTIRAAAERSRELGQ